MNFDTFGINGKKTADSENEPEYTSEFDVKMDINVKKKKEFEDIANKALDIVIDEIVLMPGDPENIQRKIVLEKTNEVINNILKESKIFMSVIDKQKVAGLVIDEVFGYGPITNLLNDSTINEVMVNGPSSIYIERKGKIEKVENTFRNDQHVMHIIDKIVAPLGRRIDESSPMVDARLPDGSRVNVIIPPLSLKGPVITIRKFATDPYIVDDLIRFGTMNTDIAKFLESCVKGRINIIVSGGTGSGKTTLLNVLSGFIPGDDRIVTIEDAAELQLKQEHVVILESRPANIEGRGRVGIRELVVNSLRMRPDRIIVGEVRSGEALDMLQAMNTGHDGSITTIHANTPRDSLARLETMVLMSGVELPTKAIREQISSAINLVIQISRFTDGSRKISKITEIVGMEGETVTMQDIYIFQHEGFDENRKVKGKHVPTGIVPKFLDKLKEHGENISPGIFRGL